MRLMVNSVLAAMTMLATKETCPKFHCLYFIILPFVKCLGGVEVRLMR